MEQELAGIDVIVGGDSHSLLGDSGLNDIGLAPVGPYATMKTRPDGSQTCIVQVSGRGRMMTSRCTIRSGSASYA